MFSGKTKQAKQSLLGFIGDPYLTCHGSKACCGTVVATLIWPCHFSKPQARQATPRLAGNV